MIVEPSQIRAARALLRIGQDELARRAHVSVVTIRRLEAERHDSRVAPATVTTIQKALEDAGAEFIDAGVRRRRHAGEAGADLLADLRRISTESATHLAGRDVLTDADLYGEDGLPA